MYPFAVRIILVSLLLLCGLRQCLAQPQPALEKLTYQLANDVLMDLHPQTNPVVIRKTNGNYQATRPRPVDDSEPLLLLDQLNHGWAAGQLVASIPGAPEWNALLEYFTEADINYMRSQASVKRDFVLRQAEITQPGVKVLRLDTLLALKKRLDWRAPAILQQRYGSRRVYGLGGALFSLNHRKALIVVSTEDGWDVYVYENSGSAWYRKATLQKGVE